MKLFLISTFLILSASVSSQSKSIPSTEISPGSDVFFAAVITPTDITITFQGPSDRWLACGFGSLMSNSDALIYSDGKPGAMHLLGVYDYDMNSQDAAGVVKDIVDDWTLISMSVSGSTRTIEASRILDTGDPADRVFTYSDPSINILWATASTSTNTLNYHGSGFRGSATLTWELPDTIPPIISGALSPADDAIDVTLATDFTITFNEDIALGAGNIELRILSSGALVEQYDVGTSSNLSVSGQSLTILPTNLLSSFTDYYVTIDSGAVSDIALNSFVGFVDSTSWNFTTLDISTDITAPLVLGAFIPADNSIGVTFNTNLTIAFDEDITFGTGNIILSDYLTGTMIESFDVSSSLNLSVSMNSFIIDPTNLLIINSEYHITIEPGAITDLIGNPFLGITDSTTWNFAVAIGAINELESFFNFVITSSNKLDIITELSGMYSVKFISLSGEIIKSIPKLFKTTSIDLSQLPKGMVILQLTSEHGVLSKKMILY